MSDNWREEAIAAEKAATPGPWWWRINTEVRQVYLFGKRLGGLGYDAIMDFRRWGTQGAKVRFNVDGLMEGVDTLVDVDHNHEARSINHPDAVFIALARTALPRYEKALAEAEREAERLKHELETARSAKEFVDRQERSMRAKYEEFLGQMDNPEYIDELKTKLADMESIEEIAIAASAKKDERIAELEGDLKRAEELARLDYLKKKLDKVKIGELEGELSHAMEELGRVT